MPQQKKLQERVSQAGQAQPPAPANTIMPPDRRLDLLSDPGAGQPSPGPGISAQEVRDIDAPAARQLALGNKELALEAGPPPPRQPPPTPTPAKIRHRGGSGRFKSPPASK
jgi:hypothetical protein